MRHLGWLAVGVGIVAVGVGLRRRRRASHAGVDVPEQPAVRDRTRGAGAGVMFVGAIDEVELGGGLARPMRADMPVDSYDPEEVPSEHCEINELRMKMPFG